MTASVQDRGCSLLPDEATSLFPDSAQNLSTWWILWLSLHSLLQKPRPSPDSPFLTRWWSHWTEMFTGTWSSMCGRTTAKVNCHLINWWHQLWKPQKSRVWDHHWHHYTWGVSCADRDAEGGVHGVCREAILPGRQVSGNTRPASQHRRIRLMSQLQWIVIVVCCCCLINLPVGSEILLV